MTKNLKGKLFLLIFVFLWLCTVSLSAEIYPAANSKASVCILNYDTEFKKNLTAALVQDFNAKEISVTVDSVSNGGQYSAKNFDAVILLSAVQAFGPLPKTVEYIKKNNYSGNIIYFATYAKFNLPYGMSLDKKKVDAITSASITNDNKVFEDDKNKIVEKTMGLIDKKKE